MFPICLAILTGLLVIGALIDIEHRRLPNWLTSAVAALYGLFVVISPTPVDWMGAFVVASLVFALGFVCFAFHAMGGGDVKLMAGLALWAGPDHIALFLIVTSLAGGLLAIVMFTFRQWATSTMLLALSFLSAPIARRFPSLAFVASSPCQSDVTETETQDSLPYGVAIAAGGFAVIYALLQL